MTREHRHKRIRKKIKGTKERPRLSLFRSNKGLVLQLIDDNIGHTLVQVHHKQLKNHSGKLEQAKKMGLLLAEEAKKKHIKEVVFDRGGYAYHGRVKAVADAAREGGLNF